MFSKNNLCALNKFCKAKGNSAYESRRADRVLGYGLVPFPIKADGRLNCHFTIAYPSLSPFVQHFELIVAS